MMFPPRISSASGSLGDRNLNAVFPGFANDPRRFLGLVKS